MSNTQLCLAMAPKFAALLGILINLMQISGIRGEVAGLRTEINGRSEINGLRSEFTGEINALRSELKSESIPCAPVWTC
jgi:hypothetical protein